MQLSLILKNERDIGSQSIIQLGFIILHKPLKLSISEIYDDKILLWPQQDSLALLDESDFSINCKWIGDDGLSFTSLGNLVEIQH